MSIMQNLIDGDTDIQAFSLFLNADAATEIPRRLNLPVQSLSHYEQYLEALKSVYTQTTGTVTVDGVNVKPVTVAVRDAIDAAILGDYKTQLEQQIASIAGGKKSYKTYAEMVAKKAEITANSIVDITNDTAENNGAYNYDGTTFTKSVYDPLTQSKSYTDTAKTAAISTAATDATTKANTAKSEAISASATDATSKANAAQTAAIAAASTDATNKANAAKSYADNRLKLQRPIVGSKALSEELKNTGASTYYDPAGTKFGVGMSTDKTSHGITVKPNTQYTLVVTSASAPQVREFPKKPDTQASSVLATAGYAAPVVTVQSAPNTIRQASITTLLDTTYIVLDASSNNFILVEGAYDISLLALLSIQDEVVNVPTNFEHLHAKKLTSDIFTHSKNLFEGYYYGALVYDTRLVGSEGTRVFEAGSAIWQTDFKDKVGVIVKVKPNTTYTISKEPSDRFAVLLCPTLSSSKLVFRDSSKQSFTVTTRENDNFIAIWLSEKGQLPKVQVEVGDKVTEYESRGQKFSEAALPLGRKLTDQQKQTENTYINLGIQTDRFKNMGTAVATPETGYTTQTILDDFYEPLLTDYPSIVSKNLLGKDSSGLNDIYEYVFEPDHVEQTIFITAGMHPTEKVTSFALGILLNEIYRNPSKHKGLAYLRNRVKICVIPVLNTWATNQNPKVVPQHYTNFNKVNINRNFPERWETIIEDGPYNKKGASAASEVETQYVMQVLHREKDNLAFYIDCHTGQGWTQDSLMYWLEEDNFLRPQLEQVVSMRNDIVRAKYGREPINETYETQRATSSFYSWRVLGVPASTVEYGAVALDDLGSSQTTDYTDLLFNCIHYALNAKIKTQIKQAERNEHNKPFLSLYNTLSGYNNVVNQVWSYAEWQTKLYDKLGLTKSSMGAASGTYDLVKYTHAPIDYKNTIILSAGAGGSRKSVTALGFIAHKLMTDSNPHIVELRSSTRFIFIPCLNPDGYDNKKTTNANNVDPFVNFATSTQPESVALRALVDAGGFDLYVDLSGNTNLTTPAKPSGYADLQVIYNNKADADHRTIFSLLDSKYKKPVTVAASKFSSSITKSNIAAHINAKNVAYESVFLAQNVLPVRVTIEGKYVDYGYEADELAYCAEVVLNSVKSIDKKLSLIKYLAAI